MGLFDRLFRRQPPPEAPRALPEPAVEVAKAAAPTDVLGRPGFDVHGGYLAERERSGDLTGERKWTTYANNVRNVGIVGAPVRRFLEFVGAPGWSVPAYDDTPEQIERAEFAKAQLANLATPWRVATQTACMSRFNGATVQAWTARVLPDGRVGLADVADRPMHTITRWLVDDAKRVIGVVQTDTTTGAEFQIPRERMVWSLDVPLTDSPAGVGIYRHIAEPVRELNALRKMSRQGFETDLSGIPVAYAPVAEVKSMIGKTKPGGGLYSQADYTAAIADVLTFSTNHVRTKETGLVLDSGAHRDIAGNPNGPPLYKLELLQAGGQAHAPVLEAMRDVRWEIAICTGFEDLLLGADGSGSLAMQKAKTVDRYRLISGALNAWAEVVQRDILRPLWALNGWDPMEAPLPTWDRGEFESVIEVLAGVLGPLASVGVQFDRSNPGDLALINAALARVGLPPLEADDADLLLGPRGEAARAAGIDKPRTAPDGEDNPEGVDVDVDDVED